MMTSPRSQAGTTLIEALAAIVIFSFGIIGIASLQLTLLHSGSDTRYRAMASMYAEELIGMATADFTNASNYTTTGSGTSLACSSASNTGCGNWLTEVKALPSGSATVTYDSTTTSTTYGQMVVTVTWTSATDGSTTSTYKSIANLRAVQALPQS